MEDKAAVFPKREFYFKLKEESQLDSFVELLFANRIPHESLSENIFSISLEDKERFEQMGFRFEEAEIINLSALSLVERNAIKEKCRQRWLVNRGKAIVEFLEKYGNKKGGE